MNNGRTSVAKNKRITGIPWLNAAYSVTIILPKRLAEKHGINEGCTVVFEDTEDGILIKKLKL